MVRMIGILLGLKQGCGSADRREPQIGLAGDPEGPDVQRLREVCWKGPAAFQAPDARRAAILTMLT
jgi:hypothetical protein